MLKYRFALSIVALAACQCAQAAGDVRTPVGTGDAKVVTNITTAQEKATTEPAGVQPQTEPRIIRGNDLVIATPKAGKGIEGAASAFKFEDAPISEVVHTIMREIIKVDYVLHQPVTGSVTLATRAEVSPDQAVFLLESALQANGLLMARDSRGIYHVGRPEALKGIVAAPRQSGRGPLPPGYGTIIVPLQYIGAAEMATILRPMMPAEALVRVDNVRNLLVLVGTRTQAEGWLDLVSTFDVDLLKGMSVGVFPLKYASVREVEAALQLMTGGVGAGASAPGGAPPVAAPGGAAPTAGRGGAAATESLPLFGAVRVMPIERLNSILVVTSRASYLDEARSWIERLDKPSDNSAEPRLYVYPVQNGSARHLADVLNGIFGDGKQSAAPTGTGVAPGLSTGAAATAGFGSAATSAGGFSMGGTQSAAARQTNRTQQSAAAPVAVSLGQGGIRVMADEKNNAVLVWASRSEYAKIESTLKRLDLPPTQVLIEASIIEVTLNDDLKYGLQWVFSDNRPNTGYTGTGVLSSAGGGALGGALAGFSYTLRNPIGNVRAILNALAEKSLVKVISSPSLMVLDNHTASISVGNQQPIRSSETVSTEGNVRTTSIQYKDTGVGLIVTPSVNAGNIVTMQIDQSVTDVGAIDEEATGQRAFLQRQISSKVAVRSGEAVVLGGLIRDNATSGRAGVPILQDVPLFGNLFGSNTTNATRTELLVIITPRVVRSDLEIREVGDDLRERMRGFSAFERSKSQRSPGSEGLDSSTNYNTQ